MLERLTSDQDVAGSTLQARSLLITGGGGFPQTLDLSQGLKIWSSQWLSGGNLGFQNNND